MIEQIVVLYLTVANIDTGEQLYKNRIVIDGFSVSGNRIEDCWTFGVRIGKKYSAYIVSGIPMLPPILIVNGNQAMKKRKDEMKAYATVDEWLDNEPSGPFELKTTCEWWAREGWKQAMRSARVQEIILLGEMKRLSEELQGMEKKWNTSWNEDDE